MSLSALIKKGGLRELATATPATSATDESLTPPSVATVATVAVATAPDKAANDPAHAQDFDREAFEERAAIMEYDGGVSRAEAEALSLRVEERSSARVVGAEVDWQCWPHTEAMNTAEIDAFTARLHLFTRHGLNFTETERLADELLKRDRAEDDRRLCLECLHLRGCGTSWTCNQWRRAGLAVSGVPAETIHVLQRCKGFKS